MHVRIRSGDDFLGDAADVESAARWSGTPGELVCALLDAGGGAGAGFIEPAETSGTYRVHDLWHHAPDYVRRRRQRERERCSRESPRPVGDRSVTGQWQDGDGQVRTASPEMTALPHPLPHPHPEDQTPRAIRARPRGADALEERFDRFWAQYPRKVGKGAALKAWKQIGPDDALTDRMLAAIAVQARQAQWRKDNGQFVPHPATWLRRMQWEDEPDAIRRADIPIVPREAWTCPHQKPCANVRACTNLIELDAPRVAKGEPRKWPLRANAQLGGAA